VSWYRVGDAAELRARVPVSISAGGHHVALFVHEGRFCAISNRCNHEGGPLAEGHLRGEFVMCPWYAWEYRPMERAARKANPLTDRRAMPSD
jgi:nitrite reductase/ring-hydroxylating ferredoxin subunit